MSSSVGDKVNEGINRVVMHFGTHPFDFLYESDIQGALYSALHDQFEDLRFVPDKKLFRSRLHIDRLEGGVNPVKTEYPGGIRFDVAIIDTSCPASDEGIWALPCRVGFEIKYWQVDGTGGQVTGDIRKLMHYQEQREKQNLPFLGISLLFLQPGTQEHWLLDYEILSSDLADLAIPNDGMVVQIIDVSANGPRRRSASEWLAKQIRRDASDLR